MAGTRGALSERELTRRAACGDDSGMRKPALALAAIAFVSLLVFGLGAWNAFGAPRTPPSFEQYLERERAVGVAIDPSDEELMQALREDYAAYAAGLEDGQFTAGLIFLGLAILQALYLAAIVRFLRGGDADGFRKVATLAMIPGVSPGIVLGVPFGFWGLHAFRRDYEAGAGASA